VLSDPAVSDTPQVQIDRAVLLSDMAENNRGIALLKDHLRAHPDSIRGIMNWGE
jgi:hypothetical protein